LPPFTNGEVLHALSLVMPDEIVAAARRESNASPAEPCTFWVSDSILLVLATISDDFASRVTEFRPDLRQRVDEVRHDPAVYIQALRAGYQEADGNQDAQDQERESDKRF
jgi:hypothetical protein